MSNLKISSKKTFAQRVQTAYLVLPLIILPKTKNNLSVAFRRRNNFKEKKKQIRKYNENKLKKLLTFIVGKVRYVQRLKKPETNIKERKAMDGVINRMIEEQFGTGKVSEKLWFVMTDDRKNLAKQPLDEDGRFHPAILLEGFHGETKIDAVVAFRRCYNTQRIYGVVETIDEAKKVFTYAPIVHWNGTIIQE
jgi:hypothetical protein